jgi:IstB-like ATP binding protein
VRDRRTHLSFLEALLAAELEERERNLIERRLREARLPRMKTLEDFDFLRNPKVSALQIQELAQGSYIAFLPYRWRFLNTVAARAHSMKVLSERRLREKAAARALAKEASFARKERSLLLARIVALRDRAIGRRVGLAKSHQTSQK